jgi:hypothetical protein
MKCVKLFAVMAVAALVTSVAQAGELNDAGAKIRGNYNFYSAAPGSSRMVFRAPAMETDRRAFSYDAAPAAKAEAAPAAKAAPAPQASAPQTMRRFSYEPTYSNRRSTRTPSWYPRYLHGDSKVLGHFND